MGVDLAVMGDKEPQADSDELVHYSEPARGVYKKLIIRNGRLAGAILLGDGLAAPNVLQSFDRGEILPENRAVPALPRNEQHAPVFPNRRDRPAPPTPRFATATASPRARLTKRSNPSRTETRPSAQSAPPPGPAPAAAPASPRCKPSWTMQRRQPCLSP